MSSPLLLEGRVDTRDQELVDLRRQLADLEDELVVARAEAKRARGQIERGVRLLREATTPLFNGLKMIHGQMDDLVPDNGVTSPSGSDKWDAIKKRMTPRLAGAIDILLVQGGMRRTQLASAMKMDYSNCSKNVITILLRQGLLVDNGGELSLKEL